MPCWIYLWLAEWRGWLKRDGMAGADIQVFQVVRGDDWHSRAWLRPGWGGLALPGAIVLNDQSSLTRFHELRHIEQWKILGALFPLVYGFCAFAYGYRNNPLEADARDHAAWQWRWYMRKLNEMQAGGRR